MTLLRAVASRLLCGGDVSTGALSPDLKTLAHFSRRHVRPWLAGIIHRRRIRLSRRRDDRSLEPRENEIFPR